jgi:hypothetical protein
MPAWERAGAERALLAAEPRLEQALLEVELRPEQALAEALGAAPQFIAPMAIPN